MINHRTEITIVGGGPVGLYLAGILLQNGIDCIVLEKKLSIDEHSKSLGIHPVSLELFEEAGIVNQFLDEGLTIKKGIAFWNRDKIGEISFERCPKPYQYILAIPQWRTESILEEWVLSIAPKAIIRGAEVTALNESDDSVHITFQHEGREKEISSRYLVGCDGKNSFIRKALGISFEGGPYPDNYIMGDFSDNTGFGSDAAVYLHKEGLIESFPLPNGHRRWVVKTDEYIENPDSKMLKTLVHDRIGHFLEGCENYMMSSFGVQHHLTEKLYSGRSLLAGDAAHVVSPIGGQGMNLGWIGARHCAKAITKTIESNDQKNIHFEQYSAMHRKISKQVARRAELNMFLGRKETSNQIFKMLVYLLINTRLSHLLAKLFTMRGLGKWVI
jgi:2-polyprenyl-6-methoxyphenol hydroxylase-like FAD-dependent oxidoreductase